MQHIDPTDIEAKWGVGLEAARRTLECTTQRGLCTVLHTSLSPCLRMNDRQLRYRRLRHDVLVTLFFPELIPSVATIISRYLSQSLDGHVCFPWLRKGMHMRLSPCCFNGMDCLPRLFLTVRRSRIWENLNRNVAEDGCHLRHMEPYSP